ncbi:MAG TPA: glycoside hydrolase family 65 protein [Puia sp.]|nr:glycoside hydrolase family 65 protein [Puia sp.]
MKKQLLPVKSLSLFWLLLGAVIPGFTQNINPWIISASPVNPAGYYGVTVANGMIGIVSSPEPFKVKDVVLAGAYDEYGRGRVSNFLRSFNLLNMRFSVDGQDLGAKDVTDMKQSLDMQHASFTTSFNYLDKATVSYTYYALRQLPFTVLMDITVTAKKDIEITPASVMEAPDALRDVQNYYNEIDRPHVLISLLTSSARSPTGKLLMCASNTFLFSEPHGEEPRVIHEMWDNNLHLMKFYKKIRAGEAYRFSIVGSSITSAHHEDPLNEAERLTIFAKLQERDRLIQFHNQAWDALWKADINIEGDEQSQQDVHSMLYHLYSFSREGTALSLSPMGLSGLGYNGHVFWDADLWMFPALLMLHPEIARSLVEYRFERLDAAKKNAFSHGYQGAMFPWESAASGVEETPVWALSGPFEHHITACVGLAAWQYFCVSQNKDWLREKGWPILSATADFWASRVERNGPGHYDIKNVVAADEWAENVDDDAFTNGAAAMLLRHATEAARILGIPADPDWIKVADNIPILRMANGVIREHATYQGEGIKQADVNLLAYPLELVTDPVQIRKDLTYYQSRVPNAGTPAMTQAIFALLYARLGEGDTAFHYFQEAYHPNLNPPFRVIAETKGGTNPYFATGAGGILQSVLMGFGGLDITEKGIVQVPSKLPAAWKKLSITGVGRDKKNYQVK